MWIVQYEYKNDPAMIYRSGAMGPFDDADAAYEYFTELKANAEDPENVKGSLIEVGIPAPGFVITGVHRGRERS